MLRDLIGLLPLALLGLALWRWGVAGRLRAVDGGEPRPHGLLPLFLLGWLGTQILALLAWKTLDLEPEDLGLRGQLAMQTGATLGAVGLMLLLACGAPGGVRALGLRRVRPGLTLLAAVAAWLAFLPALAACAQLNAAALRLVGQPVQAQDYLSRFLAEDGAGSPGVWLAIGLLLPAAEELLFRGALYGGLRRRLHPGGAMLLSGLVFGAAHDPVVILPVAALGTLLAWLYERTGSLAAPLLVHAIQNTSSLVVATFWPELTP